MRSFSKTLIISNNFNKKATKGIRSCELRLTIGIQYLIKAHSIVVKQKLTSF